MGIVETLNDAIDVTLHPTATTKKRMSIGDAYGFYYRATLIPLIVYILFSLIFVSAAGYILVLSQVTAPLLGLGYIAAIAVPIVVLWILNPIGIFVGAGILHIVGRATGQFKADFENTLTSTLYSRLPTSIFAFLLAVPFVSALYIIFSFWSLIVYVISLANLQKLSWPSSLGLLIMAGVIVLAIVGLAASVIALHLGASALAWLRTNYVTASNLG